MPYYNSPDPITKMCCVSLDFNSFEHIFARWMTVKHDYEKNCFSCAP